ncbi:MAG: lysylphosphatidylglycerol synthase transmembrane domain-containing protein [Candidatus Neomarinimicrobiota bacterium]|nr:lysylphosphatidylglycerol synthase transmembrane domain-containing protein [Candidatus Neomarinimicrobiota bacterium]MEE3241533.1 lysylphosphatidylglycerol synthase transmembrane domain-containing protein [Candidatus Neomarinimicrobiota bacterium]
MKKILSFAVSLICLYLAFRQVNLNDISTTLSQGKFLYIIYAFGITGLTFLIRAIRWNTLLGHPSSYTIHHFSSATHIGYFLNNILPLRAGDLVRAKLLSNHDTTIKMSYVIGSLVGEKIIDLWIIGLFTMILIGFGYTDVLGTQFTLILVGAYCLSSLIIFGRHTISNKLLQYFPVLENFIDGYKLVSKNKLRLGIWSIILWITFVVYVSIALQSIGIVLDIQQVLGLTILSSIVTSMPLAPAAIGTYHLAVIYCLNSLYGIDLEKAQSAAIVMHSIFLVYTIILGYIYLLSEGINIKSITNDEKN